MVIHGLQKMTLLDFPGHVACTIFTAGCNFRCPFCHNASLVEGIAETPPYTEQDIFDFLSKRKGLLEGVAITGGEPLVQKDIEQFIRKIRDMGFLIKLDTNGSFPEKLKDLIDKKLVDYVAMDIKNCKEKYPLTAGAGEDIIPKIDASIKILLENKVDYEFRTTVSEQYHSTQDIEKAAEWIKGAKRYFLQVFTDSGDILSDEILTAPSNEILQKMLESAQKHTEKAALRGI
ncbi:MAG: anaerobic ribonucleoside-triphosphate reductase activating protein [Clostridiales bacterium]|nr:anaerobic ribonucleoside-triphosphate reductase activating protein [Candidatus Equinaster intestinalis]